MVEIEQPIGECAVCGCFIYEEENYVKGVFENLYCPSCYEEVKEIE
jgi:hypothetical protein